MAETAKRRFDAIASLRTGQWENFNERRQYEWKFAFGLWTAAALAISNFVIQGPICVEHEAIIWFGIGVAVAAIVAHWWFLWGLHRVNVLDRDIMRDDEKKLRVLAKAKLEARLEQKIEERIEERRPFLHDWSYIPQFIVTLCLYSGIMLLISSSHVRPSCTGESWTISTQNIKGDFPPQLKVQKDWKNGDRY